MGVIVTGEDGMLTVAGLHHEYGPGQIAIDDISFEVGQGQFTAIVGPSGCGKTTLLKAIAGLLPYSGGSIELLGEKIEGVPPDMAAVFQDYSRSLYPWLRVAANVELPLRYRRDVDETARRQRVSESLEAVGLSGNHHEYPWQLSGGMQQRVAIARALAYHPKLMLMDEPFASVDAQTRSDLEDLITAVHNKLGMTMLFVTHDIDEAVYLADRVIVLTNSPSRVARKIEVDLPPERDQIETKASQRFVALRSEVAGLIRHRGGSAHDHAHSHLAEQMSAPHTRPAH
jgi:NitT/TauT family transport system ATP-binding protein